MKTLLTSKTIIALAVAIAASAANVSNAYEQPIPPPSAAALPAGIAPDSNAGQVLKLVQAGVDASTINTFIANCAGPFNLDAAKIIALNDAGVPSNLIDAMLARDRSVNVNAQPPIAAPAPVEVVQETTVDTAPPPVTINYFNDTLSPYGTWVEVAGYGRCWRPTTVIYQADWRPYSDRGHWVYTDCGWYWDSDYAWGATFHYGRWFRDARFGWCWWPDTDWAPSWVLWRSGGDYCGWAPLPPRCLFRREGGFFWNGSNVAIDFDFGFDENYFIFVGYDHFGDRHWRDYRADHNRAGQIFHNTTIVNNYNFNGERHTVFNGGISPERLAAASHHPIHPVNVSDLPNAARQGWRGDEGNHRPGNFVNTAGHFGAPVLNKDSARTDAANMHSSRLEQQRERAQQNANYPAQMNPPITSTPQGIASQPNHSSRLEQQRNQALAAPVQRPQNFVPPQQIARPVPSQTVLAPQMEQRLPRQLDNHVYQAPPKPAPNLERAENRYQPTVQPVQPQHVERAPAASNSGNQNSGNNGSNKGNH